MEAAGVVGSSNGLLKNVEHLVNCLPDRGQVGEFEWAAEGLAGLGCGLGVEEEAGQVEFFKVEAAVVDAEVVVKGVAVGNGGFTLPAGDWLWHVISRIWDADERR